MYQYGAYQNFQPPIQSQIIRVRGEQSARSINLAPNSSILLMDESDPIVWLCTTDGVGSVQVTPYDISPHKQKTIDLSSIEQRVEAIEKLLEGGKDESNGKSVKRSSKSSESQGGI